MHKFSYKLKKSITRSLYIKQIQNAPSSNRLHFEIDEFINQLMTSEKFSELADVIAERAARKIQTVENSNKTSLRNSDHSVKTENNKDIEEKETYTRISEHEGKKIDKDNSGKFGKINTKAFLKHDDSSQELYLNYKHMTEDFERTKDLDKKSSKKVDDTSPERDNKRFSDNSREQSFSKHTKKEKTMYESKNIKIKRNERKNLKFKSRIGKNINKEHLISSNGEHSDRDLDSITNKTSINHKITNKPRHEYSGEDKTSELTNEHNNISTEKQKNNIAPPTTQNNIDDYAVDSSHVEIKDTKDHIQVTKGSNENTSWNYSSKEVVEVGINRAHSDNDGLSERHSAEQLDFLDESNYNHGVIKPKEIKPIVRRENGKLYTFVSSPDYDEYHESIRISKRNFINMDK